MDNKVLWQEYTEGKQTYRQLARQYGVSPKTIQRRLDRVDVKPEFCKPKECIIMMDTTYFGRDFGVMAFQNTEGQQVYWRFVKYETIAGYVEGINYIRAQSIGIKG